MLHAVMANPKMPINKCLAFRTRRTIPVDVSWPTVPVHGRYRPYTLEFVIGIHVAKNGDDDDDIATRTYMYMYLV